jgi:hypothetical protein
MSATHIRWHTSPGASADNPAATISPQEVAFGTRAGYNGENGVQGRPANRTFTTEQSVTSWKLLVIPAVDQSTILSKAVSPEKNGGFVAFLRSYDRGAVKFSFI